MILWWSFACPCLKNLVVQPKESELSSAFIKWDTSPTNHVDNIICLIQLQLTNNSIQPKIKFQSSLLYWLIKNCNYKSYLVEYAVKYSIWLSRSTTFFPRSIRQSRRKPMQQRTISQSTNSSSIQRNNKTSFSRRPCKHIPAIIQLFTIQISQK